MTATQSVRQARGAFQVFADLSFRIKLIVVFAVITLLSVGIIALLNIRSMNTALTRQVGNGLATLADSEAHTIGGTLASHVISMQQLSLDQDVQSAIAAQNAAYLGDSEAIRAEVTRLDGQWVAAGDDDPLIKDRLGNQVAGELGKFKRNIPGFAEVFVTDRYGGLVAASDRTSDYNQGDEEWWQAAYSDGQGAVFIAPPEFDESSGVVGVDMAVPVYSGNEIVGILRTTLDVTALVSRLSGIKLGEQSEADLLIDGVLFTTHTSGDHELDDPAAFTQLAMADKGYTQVGHGEHRDLTGYATVASPTGEQFVSDLGWKVVIRQAELEALSAVRQQTRNTATLILAVMFFVIVVAVVIGQVLARPIARLTDMVTRFTQGDLSARAEIDSRDEAGVLAASFNQMAEQVGGLLTSLQARTRALETSAQVSRRLSTILDQGQLVAEVVEQLQQAFGYYHVHIYLLDETSQDPSTGSGQVLVMAGGTGAAGRALLADGHRIAQGKGLVGRAAQTKAAVLVPDVTQDEGWLPNPLLPDTRSEVAVPILAGERVLGVLDVQHDVSGGLGEGDVELLASIAGQAAVALQNTRLFAETRRQAERETRVNRIAQRIQSATTVESALQIAVRELGQVLGAPHTQVKLETAAAKEANGREVNRL